MFNKNKVVAIDFSSTGAGGGPFVSNMRLIKSGLNKKYIFKPFIYRTELGRFISIKRILDIKRQLLKIKPDIVHFSGLGLMGFHIAVACRLAGIRNTVVTVHGLTNDALNVSWIVRFIMTFFFEPITIILAKKNYGVSKYVSSRKMLNIINSKNSGYIYNIPTDINYVENMSFIREELKIDPNKRIVVTVGRIIRDKGFHILEESIKMCESLTGVVFLIIGTGSYMETMKKELDSLIKSKKVFFLGHRNDVQQILYECDIFVLPTLHETLSIALLEASSASLPLIASNTGGVPEIVENGYNGILVNPGSAVEIKNAITTLYLDQTLCKIYGKNAKNKITEKFSQNEIEAKVDSIYQQILSNN